MLEAIKKLFFLFITGLFLFGVAGCVLASPPVEEYAFARAAMDAARSVEAARHSPGYFHQAEDLYRRALQHYEERDFEDAKSDFVKCKSAAEKAENSARLIRMKTGEVL